LEGICDTCGERAREVFQPDGRTDLVCSDCYVNVETAIKLYEMLSKVERTGGRALELEAQFELTLHRMFSRVVPSGRMPRERLNAAIEAYFRLLKCPPVRHLEPLG
jgi:hypothetical protein